MNPDQRQKITELLKGSQLAVIATHAGTGAPESAVITISETEDCGIIFGSFSTTRKNQNIKKNPQVSLVIGWDIAERKTIQIEGEAVLLEGQEREEAEAIHCAKNKGHIKYQGNPLQEYFKIVPSWIRYSHLSVEPSEVWEVRL